MVPENWGLQNRRLPRMVSLLLCSGRLLLPPGMKRLMGRVNLPRKYPASTPQVLAILDAGALEAKTREELQAAAGIKDREHFRKQYLELLLSAGLLERTLPNKPNSPKQRYRTTAAGHRVLKDSEKGSQS